MILFPNAKINLGLDILRRRADGYHDISTVMVPVPWRDVLEIVPASGYETTLTVTGRGVACPPEKNLVIKAYRALESIVELPPVDIYLRKIIPDGAGLGGGSADASFTLKGLNELFALGFDDSRLAEIASGLGADCPFFIYNRPMLCTGIGDVMTDAEVDLSGLGILIVKPDVSVPTGKAYSRVTPHEPDVTVTDIISRPTAEWQNMLKNDFEPSVFAEFPVIAALKEKIMSAGAIYASMSGSGASVFGLFDGDKLSALTDRELKESFSGCDTFHHLYV